MKPSERIILNISGKFNINKINQFLPYIGAIRIGIRSIYPKMSELLFSVLENNLHSCLGEILEFSQLIRKKVFFDIAFIDNLSEVVKSFEALCILGPKMISVYELEDTLIKKMANHKSNLNVFGKSASMHMKDDECMKHFGTKIDAHIVRFADNLVKMNFLGVVCSFEQAYILRSNNSFNNLLTMCPLRYKDPREMIGNGIDYLIVGDERILDIRSFQILEKEIALGLCDRKLKEAHHELRS